MQGGLEEEDYQGQHERVGSWGIDTSDEGGMGTRYHLSCIGNPSGWIPYGKWISGESLGCPGF